MPPLCAPPWIKDLLVDRLMLQNQNKRNHPARAKYPLLVPPMLVPLLTCVSPFSAALRLLSQLSFLPSHLELWLPFYCLHVSWEARPFCIFCKGEYSKVVPGRIQKDGWAEGRDGDNLLSETVAESLNCFISIYFLILTQGYVY